MRCGEKRHTKRAHLRAGFKPGQKGRVVCESKHKTMFCRIPEKQKNTEWCFLVARPGFEPGTPWLKVKCSTDWASEPYGRGGRIWTYGCKSQSLVPYHLATPLQKMWCSLPPILAGVVGFEPTQCWSQSPMPYRLATPHQPPWRWHFVGWSKGVEPLTSRATIWRSTNWAKTTTNGAPRRIRTSDLCLRRALLYPAELWKHMEQVKGIGPSQPAWKASVLPLNYTCKCSNSLACGGVIVKKKHKKN